jgi:hypothetical protein
MPIVTITTSNRLTGETGRPTTTWPFELGEALPEMFHEHRRALHLHPGTPIDATQVDFDEFHVKSINTPDIWILIQFTEVLSDRKMCEARDEIKWLIMMWLERLGPVPPNLAVDIFWGPSHGFMRYGAIRRQW